MALSDGSGENLPTANDDTGACWRGGPYEPESSENSISVGPGGFERRYLVYATPDNEPCIPTDTYRFVSTEYGVPGGPTGLEWSFEVTVTESVRT
ncbi:hypothetical protein [Halorussus caseinilyticus]|uniref:Uncharacterized protein n=1 Tax=Halorussus caseinilyticus TaxID=3034025 RepID=A0ABD5WLH1_9EURY